ncbi:hypothetical protein PSTT_09179, partial [Puccinia striiformis]
EVYDKVFLGKILDRFQALPTHEKPEWILRFGKLLDMTHVLKRLEEPIDQPCKGQPRGSKNKSKAPAKSTKPEPSRHEHLAAPKKRGRPRKDKDSKEESKKKKLNNKQKNGKRKKSDTGKSLSESTEGSSSDDEELTDRENQIGIATVAATLTALSTSTAPDVLGTSSNTDVWSNFNEGCIASKAIDFSIHNVEGNVNCGFARPQSVRTMATAMTSHAVYKNKKYLRTINNEISYDKLLVWLTFRESPAPPRMWTTFPRHGDLLADAYQRPVIHISKLMLVTFLPLSHGPTSNPPIFLVFLEGQDHCNAFNCHEGIYPAPEILIFWYKWRSDEAKGWEAVMEKHHNEWIKRVFRQTGWSTVLNIG